MLRLPESISLANLPTRIEKLERLSKSLNKEIYIKRDDQTGTEISGNKVRKLEFAVKEAMNQGCDYLITCGGIQSNHARSTAAVAARLGMGAFLVLRSSGDEPLEGNYFMDKLLGARIRLITREEYREKRMTIMEEIRDILAAEGHKAYIIPEGASNGIGTFGYFKAMEEILAQEKQMGVKFDAIVLAVGSGGTYSGLFYANKAKENEAKVYGFNICDDAAHFKSEVSKILKDSFRYTQAEIPFTSDDILIVDGYVGEGYALSRPEELAFIRELAGMEGIILDPVYTGKAMYGLVQEIRKGTFAAHQNILFIHTGGLYGLFPKRDQFGF